MNERADDRRGTLKLVTATLSKSRRVAWRLWWEDSWPRVVWLFAFNSLPLEKSQEHWGLARW
jgi:hypothetical protein